MNKKDVQGFIDWAREFVGTVRDQKNRDMTDEFREQLDTLQYLVLRKPEYEKHDCVSPCEIYGGRCQYPLSLHSEERHCKVCGWVE